jgi:hypothetical protein
MDERNNIMPKRIIQGTFEYYAALASFLVVSFAVVFFVSQFVLQYAFRITNTNEAILTRYFEQQILTTIIISATILSTLFLIPTAIGIFMTIKKRTKLLNKNIILIPTIGMIIGSMLMVIIQTMNYYTVFILAPDFVNGSSFTRAVALNNYISYNRIVNILSIIVYVLMYGAGAFGFSYFILGMPAFNDTTAWIGIFCGVLSLGQIGIVLPNTAASFLTLAANVGSIMFYFWIYSIGNFIYQKELAKMKGELDEEIEENLLF